MTKAPSDGKSAGNGKPSTVAPAKLAEAVKSASSKGPPPVHLWNPPFSGDFDMRIARDGTWFHEGSPINRHALVQLFSSILKTEDGEYFLVTPVEKYRITVEDVPFVAIDVDVDGNGTEQTLTFTTHVGDVVTAGRDHPIRITQNPETGEPSPYVEVRAGLEARIDRKSFYRMIELGAHEDRDGESWFGVWSAGQFFPIAPSSELEA